MTVELKSLDPVWIFYKGETIGIVFRCPVEGCPITDIGAFWKPGPDYDPKKHSLWKKTGDRFETLTLSPSLDATKNKKGVLTGCKFHGWIKNGLVEF